MVFAKRIFISIFLAAPKDVCVSEGIGVLGLTISASFYDNAVNLKLTSA
jgi:hypothetical protein